MEYIHDSTACPYMVAPLNGFGGSTLGGSTDMTSVAYFEIRIIRNFEISKYFDGYI